MTVIISRMCSCKNNKGLAVVDWGEVCLSVSHEHGTCISNLKNHRPHILMSLVISSYYRDAEGASSCPAGRVIDAGIQACPDDLTPMESQFFKFFFYISKSGFSFLSKSVYTNFFLSFKIPIGTRLKLQKKPSNLTFRTNPDFS